MRPFSSGNNIDRESGRSRERDFVATSLGVSER